MASKTPSGYSGRKGFELQNSLFQNTRNSSLEINGRLYVDHALDQMQNRGILPNVVENTIKQGVKNLNKIPGRVQFYDHINNISVITENDAVITVTYGIL